jgi:hypothetical protein
MIQIAGRSRNCFHVAIFCLAKMESIEEPALLCQCGEQAGYGLGDRVSIPCLCWESKPYATASRPALGLTQPPVQWVLGYLSPEEKWLGRVNLTTHFHLVPKLRMRGAITT